MKISGMQALLLLLLLCIRTARSHAVATPTSKVKVPNYLTEEVLVRIIEGASAKRSQDKNPES